MDRYSNFTQLKYFTAWILHFIHNCHLHGTQQGMQSSLSTQELLKAEAYWLLFFTRRALCEGNTDAQDRSCLAHFHPLLSLRPILDSAGVLRVGGRERNSRFCYSAQHPAILHGKHPVTKLLSICACSMPDPRSLLHHFVVATRHWIPQGSSFRHSWMCHTVKSGAVRRVAHAHYDTLRSYQA